MRRPCTKLIGESPFDLGSKVGTWLIERGFSPKYTYVGIHKEGSGLWEHAYHKRLLPVIHLLLTFTRRLYGGLRSA